MSINRYSSRQTRLGHVYLREKLIKAKRYLRIAGYFRSSLFELIHEDLDDVGEVRMVCNSDLDPRDVGVARSAQQQAMALKEKWNEGGGDVADAVLRRERYQRLYKLLKQGNLKIRVVGRNSFPFLHGKAGVIEASDGTVTSFLGSLNETREGWNDNYELLWEDTSQEAVKWVTDEFEFLWSQGIDLPDVIIKEVERCANRMEYATVEACPSKSMAAAAMAEAPIYRRGEALMPWQQAFVGMFLEHRDIYGAARFLLADEVGVGKTLSLATSAVLSALLNDGPAIIFCPATLTQQWQVELFDKLGVPSAVWTSRKTWLDHTGHHIRTRGAEDIARCPYQIAIVSTGLIFHRAEECEHLLRRSYGTLVLDEAHRARRAGGLGKNGGEPNNLLSFMFEAAKRSKHVLLGTATPIQTRIEELWDLLEILNRGADHVLGRAGSNWRAPSKVLPLVTGEKGVEDEGEAWDLMRNPLPPRHEDPLFEHIRSDFGIEDNEHFTSRHVVDLDEFTREELKDKVESSTSGLGFFQRNNPIVRHTVLRRRSSLEERGLLPKIAVDIHPSKENQQPFFDGLGLLTSPPIDNAYAEAVKFTELLGKRTKAAGFMKSLLLQRICSSLASGMSTAQKMLKKETLDDDDDAVPTETFSNLTSEERESLEKLIEHLSEKPEDPKFEAVCHYLLDSHWLDLGCIVFSQYYDTTFWVAQSLAKKLPKEPLAVYAGADRSGIFRDGQWSNVEREDIKKAVRNRQLRLVVATDAACEGLNLQTLGTLINVDLPWNPSRLEQRIGRIKRIGQARTSVDMLNLVYHGTRDEVVYARLSARMKDRYDIFGSLPDVIEDDWIEHIEDLDEYLSTFIEKRKNANAFELRYGDTVDPDGEPWERCSTVLSRRDIVERLSRAW